MTVQQQKQISKFLSLILRHKPELIGLELDVNGWASVPDLLQRLSTPLTFEELKEIVDTNDKQRFAFNEDQTMIRASQGHSISRLDLDLSPQQPPENLYHGTVAQYIQAIQEEGLQKMSRQYVHLSHEWETAIKVGSRRGKAIVLHIRAGEMHREGYAFYLSENGVWLTDTVPPGFIDVKNN